ncbi:hypothetical protein BC477_11730 [Clavibacter michiganensis subsp. michiganensis]|uniref:Uncharacterized protein n=1 Tax=Clavibacter michiganensis subsp. michiganensis TaxID=33013 RepID=A0A251XHA7_CLAMM|nr:hypothetical protein BC477_11730 [Clavibacter michiganensis subsp. michiganensis]OUE02465.1 hypothetical protein CMMCAS07_10640 [Clavibacter michiganensis subsp. michiganensis]
MPRPEPRKPSTRASTSSQPGMGRTSASASVGARSPRTSCRAARLVSEMVRNMRDASGLGAVARPLSAWTMTLVRVCASTSCMSSLMRSRSS